MIFIWEILHFFGSFLVIKWIHKIYMTLVLSIGQIYLNT